MKPSTSTSASHDERGPGETPPFSRGRRRWVAMAILALAALAAAAASLAIASGQDRGDLVPPSIAVDGSGLATVAWTEVARPGIRVAQESTPGRWSRPLVLDPVGGPGSVAVDRDRLAHIAYTSPGGLVVANQVRRADGGAPAFRRQVVDRRGLGRPAIAITGRGDTAVIYETRTTASVWPCAEARVGGTPRESGYPPTNHRSRPALGGASFSRGFGTGAWYWAGRETPARETPRRSVSRCTPLSRCGGSA